MQHVTSTRAKQAFGELLDSAVREPVEIRKHGKVRAILASPEHFASASPLALRRAAREHQAAVEQARLLKHYRVALSLLTATPSRRAQWVAQARAVVARWRSEGLSSRDYFERWEALLSLPNKELAVAMTSDLDGWGDALRQNSPWIGDLK